MLSPTAQRVELSTPPALNRKFEQRLAANIARYMGASRPAIDQRLRELDREWNVERLIETEAPLMIGLGIALGLTKGQKWFAVSALAASMVILHSLRGWYPLIPILRRLGMRTQNEIEEERNALRMLRGDHEIYRAHSIHSIH